MDDTGPRISRHLRGQKKLERIGGKAEEGKSWTCGREMKMKRECGGVADNRTTNRNGAFVSMKSGLTLCSSEWRERGRGSSQMAESKTKDGWNEGLHGSSFLCVISLGSRSQAQNFHASHSVLLVSSSLLLLFPPFHPFRAITNRNSSSRAY